MKQLLILTLLTPILATAQLKWTNVDSAFGPLPSSVHVYVSNDTIDGKPNTAYYVVADLKDKDLNFTTDTTKGRRLTPSQYYQRNNNPQVVVNATFFEFVHQSNLNLVVRNGKVLARNQHIQSLRGKDTLKYAHVFPAAIGISRKRNADVAWTYTTGKKVYAMQNALASFIDSNNSTSIGKVRQLTPDIDKWKMRTAIGGGPVILQDGLIKVSNNEERRFGGRAINDKHPRTVMGYTRDNKLIILVIQGRFPGIAEGATLIQEAQIMKDLGCIEAPNLDGGGSSCLLVNGKETIKPSDKEGQRPVPAVFMISK